jgi:hypothetical protein
VFGGPVVVVVGGGGGRVVVVVGAGRVVVVVGRVTGDVDPVVPCVGGATANVPTAAIEPDEWWAAVVVDVA